MKRKLLIIICGIIIFVLLCCVGLDIYKKYQGKNKTIEETSLISATAKEIEDVAEKKIEEPSVSEVKEEEPVPEEELIHTAIEKPVITDAVIPKDIYVLKGGEGKIKTYFEEAQEYIWEYYHEDEREWKPVSDNKNIQLTGEMDELNRSISLLKIKGIDSNDGLLVRCKVKIPNEEEVMHQAAFHLLELEKDSIKSLAVSEDFKAEAGTYVDVLDIPVKVVKKDDSEMEVTGLNDLFFYMPKEVSSDTEKNVDGTTVETVTTTSIEKEYHLITAGENNIMLRYRGTVPGIDISTILVGNDSLPPEVIIQLSDYEISSTKIDYVEIKATILAEDNYSPITKLLYAFKEKEKKVTDEDFKKSNLFDIEVSKNSIWTAYVKDEMGNIGSEDIEIIIIDQKAPVIESLELKNSENGWYKVNIISVKAKDGTTLKYCYLCEADASDSGWVDESEYEIYQNGLWEVKVKDAAGNESSKEIEVSNVDSQAPIILSVLPKKQEDENGVIDTGTLEDRVNVTVKGATVKEDSVSDTSTYEPYSNNSYVSSYNNALNTSDSRNSYYASGNTSTSVSKGEKGDRGVTGVTGSTGATGAAGKDGTSSYLHIKYADSSTGNNMSDYPVDSSRYIGIYTGTSSVSPSSASSYQWSLYKGNSSRLYIRYAESADGINMTELPKDESSYIGICSSTDSNAPEEAQNYTWSKYKDNVAITELQNKVEELQKQIEELKTPTP